MLQESIARLTGNGKNEVITNDWSCLLRKVSAEKVITFIDTAPAVMTRSSDRWAITDGTGNKKKGRLALRALRNSGKTYCADDTGLQGERECDNRSS